MLIIIGTIQLYPSWLADTYVNSLLVFAEDQQFIVQLMHGTDCSYIPCTFPGSETDWST